MRWRRSRLAMALVLAAAAPSVAVGQDQAASRLEYSVKANYLVRFTAFVDWPPAAFASAAAPVVICVAGRDPFGAVLDRAAVGKTAHGRPLAIRRPATALAARGCHLLYLGSGSDISAAPRDHPVLVVTDAAVSDRRGMVHFVLSDGRVRFHINQSLAGAAGLSISSRLLQLALTVLGS